MSDLKNMEEISKLIPFAQSYYNEPHRKYHDWEHILEMFRVAQKMGFNLTLAQKIAILYHDIVYLPGFKGNEDASAEFMYTAVNHSDPQFLATRPEIIDEAAVIIRDTQTHEASIEASCVVIDLDFYRLSVSAEEFYGYSKLLEKEFNRYTQEEFIKGQIEFYKGMLGRERIFYHEAFDEEQVRNNMFTRLQKIQSPFTGFLNSIGGRHKP